MFRIKPNFTTMKNFKTKRLKFAIASVLVAMIFNFQNASGQEEDESISIYQYRKVDDDKKLSMKENWDSGHYFRK